MTAAYISALRAIVDDASLSASAAAAIHLWFRDAEAAISYGDTSEVTRLVGLIVDKIKEAAAPKPPRRMRAIVEAAP